MKATEKDKRIESRLMEDYKKITPSLVAREKLDKHTEVIQSIIIQQLGISPLTFRSRTLLDLGCGTGETTRAYALMGARCTGIDLNPVSIKYARELFKESKLRGGFKVSSIYELQRDQAKKRRTYAIVASLGVIHHLRRSEDGIGIMSNLVAPGGIAILGVGTGLAGLQFLLIKKIIRVYAKTDDQIPTVAKRLFPIWIKRCAKFGMRTEEPVINDNIINRQHYYLPLSAIVAEFKRLGLRPFSFYQKPNYRNGDSAMNNSVDYVDPLVSLSELGWLYHTWDDKLTIAQDWRTRKEYVHWLTSIHNTIDGNTEDTKHDFWNYTGKFPNRLALAETAVESHQHAFIDVGMHEMKVLLESLKRGEKLEVIANLIKGFHVLFQGTAGLNMTYCAFYKP